MNIVIAADHAGFELKQAIIDYLNEKGHQVVDLGPFSNQASDYPQKAALAVKALKAGQGEMGVLVCGSGIGMDIAANRFLGIRAVLAPTVDHARLGRSHNNGNVLCLGARLTPPGLALKIVEEFIKTPFEGGRHQRRVDMLDQMPEGA